MSTRRFGPAPGAACGRRQFSRPAGAARRPPTPALLHAHPRRLPGARHRPLFRQRRAGGGAGGRARCRRAHGVRSLRRARRRGARRATGAVPGGGGGRAKGGVGAARRVGAVARVCFGGRRRRHHHRRRPAGHRAGRGLDGVAGGGRAQGGAAGRIRAGAGFVRRVSSPFPHRWRGCRHGCRNRSDAWRRRRGPLPGLPDRPIRGARLPQRRLPGVRAGPGAVLAPLHARPVRCLERLRGLPRPQPLHLALGAGRAGGRPCGRARGRAGPDRAGWQGEEEKDGRERKRERGRVRGWRKTAR